MTEKKKTNEKKELFDQKGAFSYGFNGFLLNWFGSFFFWKKLPRLGNELKTDLDAPMWAFKERL